MAGLLNPETEEDRIAQQRALVSYADDLSRQQARQEFMSALGNTWPAQMAKSAYQAVRAPGDVAQGRLDPRSNEAIKRAADLAGMMVTGGMPLAQRGALGTGGGRMVQPDAPGLTYWSDLAKTRHLVPVEEMSAVRVPTETLLPRQTISPERLQGSILMPAVGDRTIAGSNLTQVNQTPLSYPVALEGGPDFMRAGAAQAENAVWAADKGAAQRISKYTNEVSEGGKKDVNLVYSAMGGRSGDFSTMMSDALLAQLQNSKIAKTALKDFDASMKAQNPNWPGLSSTSDKSIESARAALLKSGPMRKQFVEEMALGEYQKAGFPEIGSTRSAISVPELIGQPTGVSGYNIAKLDPTGRLISSPAVPHTTYNTQMAGQGFLGGLETQVPRNIMFPSFYKERRAEGGVERADDRAFTIGNVSQVADQEWLDNIMRFLQSGKGQ
jgi:hypothetical protein